MYTVKKTHVVAINTLMLANIASYVKYYAQGETDLQQLQIYANDIAYNVQALQAFNKTQDAYVLHCTIVEQDTIVREHFYTVLNYIEENFTTTA